MSPWSGGEFRKTEDTGVYAFNASENYSRTTTGHVVRSLTLIQKFQEQILLPAQVKKMRCGPKKVEAPQLQIKTADLLKLYKAPASTPNLDASEAV